MNHLQSDVIRHSVRADLGGGLPPDKGASVLSLLVMSDIQVMDTISPARCEWVELLAADPHWQPLLHMHRPYEALVHWAFAAHVERARRHPAGRPAGRPYDLCLSLGDNIDNAQHNEWEAFLAIFGGGSTALSAWGGVHEPTSDWKSGRWPFWCPDASVDDDWKAQGYPAVPDFLARASATLVSHGIACPWVCLPGNHDVMRQGTALPGAAIERIATGAHKPLFRPAGFDPADPLSLFVDAPAEFSSGAGRAIPPSPTRRALDQHAWIAAQVAHGAVGYTAQHARTGNANLAFDTEQARLLLIDTNHPGGDYQGSIGTQQLEWLEAQLGEVDRQPGRFAVLASHHGSVSLVNTRGADPARKQAAALTEVAHRHPCVIAWLAGHRHLHEIRAHPGPSGGFWEISTGSLIDWPGQARAVEFLRHGERGIEIVCTLVDHGAPAGSLAHLHHSLAWQFAGTQREQMQGSPEDGNVRLWRG